MEWQRHVDRLLLGIGQDKRCIECSSSQQYAAFKSDVKGAITARDQEQQDRMAATKSINPAELYFSLQWRNPVCRASALSVWGASKEGQGADFEDAGQLLASSGCYMQVW